MGLACKAEGGGGKNKKNNKKEGEGRELVEEGEGGERGGGRRPRGKRRLDQKTVGKRMSYVFQKHF